MKYGRSLAEFSAELERQANVKQDFLVPADGLRFRSNGHTELVVGDSFPINDVAHGQIAEYAGVPKLFYDKLRAAAEDLTVPIYSEAPGIDYLDEPLFDVMMTRLFQAKGGEGRLVRTLDGNVRAFLSDTYNPDLDNFDVFRMAAMVMTDEGLVPDNVASCEVTDRKMYVKVLSPKLEAVVHPSNIKSGHPYLKEPQVVQAGFVLTNSESGLGALTVQQVVMKLMCTNLWIKDEAYRQRHIGRALQSDDAGAVYRSDTRLADAKARLLKIRDHVREALDETKFRMLVASMQQTTEIPISGSVEKVVDATAGRFGLSQGEKDGVLRNLIEGADLTCWGLTNAITATAQTVPSYDRATELEAIGGRFFTMDPRELASLAKAA